MAGHLDQPTVPGLSGRRFSATYRIAGSEAEVRLAARAICVEQTVEFPEALVPAGDIADHIVGRLEALEPAGELAFEARISYAEEIAGAEFTQLVNVLFGNVAIQPNVRLLRFDLSDGLLAALRGPRFGVPGLRAELGVTDRPLVATAIKPMGLSPARLAEMAGHFARGGIDVIKDDHGLSDQSFSRFRERVERVTAAVREANASAGTTAKYFPNLTAPGEQLLERAELARELGVGGAMISPGLVGLDGMRRLADHDGFGLPLLSHPTLWGGLAASAASGVDHYALYGQLVRIAGGDGSIFTSYGGRFAYTEDDCRRAVNGCHDPLGGLPPIFPVAGGGVTLDRLPALRAFYGADAMFLVGGGLHSAGPDLAANCRAFRDLVE